MLRELRIGTEAFLNPRAPLVGIVEALHAEEPGDDRPPGEIRRRLLDRVPRAGEDRDAHLLGALDQVGDESRFADPRLTLDHDQPARAGDEGLQASVEVPALGEPAHERRGIAARRGLAARPEDRYGLGFALEGDRREGLEGEPRPGGLAGRTVAQDHPGGRLHQPGGQVHLVADYRVFAPPPPADLSAIDAPGGDADRAAHIQLAESVPDLNRGLHTSRRVVRVGKWRQAQGGDQSQALVVEPELVEAPFVAIQGRLEGTNDGVSLIQGLRRVDVQARQVDEEHGHRAQLGDPPRLICVEP